LERANLQADLEDAQSNFRNLEREYKMKHDVAEKQRRALESLSDKVEKQRVSFQVEFCISLLIYSSVVVLLN